MKKRTKVFLGVICGVLSIVMIFVAYFLIYNFMPIKKNSADQIISYYDSETDAARGIEYQDETYKKINPDGQYNWSSISPSSVGFSDKFDKCLLSYKTKQEIQYLVSNTYDTFALKYEREKNNVGYYSIGDIIVCNNGSPFMIQQHQIYLKKSCSYNMTVNSDNVESIKIFGGDVYDYINRPPANNEKLPKFLNFLAYDWSDFQSDSLGLYDSKEFISDFLNEFNSTGSLENIYYELCEEFNRNDIFFKMDLKGSQISLVFNKYAIHNIT